MPTDDLRSLTESFTSDLVGLIRGAALEAVNEALGGSRGKPLAAARKAVTKAPASPKRGRARKPGEKRDPKELEALTAKLADYVKAHPGERIEQIKKALGVETKDLSLPVKKLLAAKLIKSKGQKRSTTYYPVGSGGLVHVKKGKRPAEGEQKPEG